MRLPKIPWYGWVAAGAAVLLLARKASAAANQSGVFGNIVGLVNSQYWVDKAPGTGWGAAPAGEKRASVQTIVDVFHYYNIPDPIIVAAIVNAYYESGWNHRALGDGGHSVGLFQLNDVGGSGKGMTVAQRQDPYTNAVTIVEKELRGSFGKKFYKKYNAGASLRDLVYWFCVYIERPAKPESDGAKRRAGLGAMFPSLGPQQTLVGD